MYKAVRHFSSLPATSDCVVIGGGVVGTSTAYHLAKKGVQVTLLERHKLTCGTTWHSAAMMNSIRGNPHEAQLVDYTRALVSSGTLEDETGVSTGWKQHGGLSITKDPERLKEFSMWSSLGKYMNWQTKMVDPQEIKYIHPLINTDGIVGGVYVPTDGSIDPTGLTNAFAKAVKLNGGSVFEDCPVSNINLNSTNAVKSVSVGKHQIYTNKVVLACGAWSRDLGRKVGVQVPIRSNKHGYVVSDIIPGISAYPNVRHYDYNIYFKVHNDTIFMGAFESNPVFVDVDPDLVYGLYDFPWEEYSPYLEKHMEVMPKLATVGQKTLICGPESFSPDSMPLFGQPPDVEGLYLNCGMSSRGIQLSGGLGREMANLIVNGYTQVDMFTYDINRFHQSYIGNQKWLEESVHEAEVRTYYVRYPTLQRLASRNLKLSPFHSRLEEAGAFFGATVPSEYDFYGYYGHVKRSSSYESLLSQEYAKWAFSPRISKAIKAEVEQCRQKAAIFDLSSFGKVVLKGPHAQEALEWLCTASMDMAVNICQYTLMLNENAGIEAEITVTRTADDEFYLVTGAATTQYLLNFIQKKVSTKFPNLVVSDITESVCILSLQGPLSQQVLQRISPQAEQLAQLSYGHATDIFLRGIEGQLIQAKVIRLSFVGELGYEIHVNASPSSSSGSKATDDAVSLLDNLLSFKPEVGLAGFEALLSMSLEKGHVLWHSDIETIDRPLEAGLGFCCRRKAGDFQGKSKWQEKPRKRLAAFTVDPQVPLNGTEVILRNGQVVGYLRRGGFGYTINQGLGTGYVDLKAKPDGQSVRDFVLSGDYQIEVMGQQYPAKVSLRPFYDPEKSKMK